MYGSISASQRASKFREYREYREQEQLEKQMQAKKKEEEEKEEKKAKLREKDCCSCKTVWYQRFTMQKCDCQHNGDVKEDIEENVDNVICLSISRAS